MFKVINKKTKKDELLDDFDTKIQAQQAIINCIRGTNDKKEALKYYLQLTVKRIKNK